METLLTVKATAAQLGVTEGAVRKWISKGRLRSVKVGRARRLRPTDVQAFLVTERV